MARLWQRSDWRLMNYGYAPALAADQPPLRAEDEEDRVCMQLYHRVASQQPLSGAEVLEVGSGRGGGAGYVHRYLGPRRTVGLERSEAAVALARRREASPGLEFVQGDAEALPFAEASFDAVLNVESCHCYGSVPTFLSEVRRVLRPGGHLLLADLRLSERVASFDAELEASGMQLRAREDITERVVAGLRQDNTRRLRLISQAAPPGLRGLMGSFAATEGSTTFRDLAEGRFRYLCYDLERVPA
jgi:SAM-dependent methyltransferase